MYYSFITNLDRLLKSKRFLGPDSHNIARGLCETQVYQQAGALMGSSIVILLKMSPWQEAS